MKSKSLPLGIYLKVCDKVLDHFRGVELERDGFLFDGSIHGGDRSEGESESEGESGK